MRQTKAPMDREATELSLERAALALLERDGVLAGLNLREVADEAGVNRGLVYHYFGNRQQLLRAALRRDTRERLASIMSAQTTSLGERVTSRYRAVIAHRESIKLLTLLALDGDSHVRMVYARQTTIPELADAMQRGEIPRDISPAALQVALNALTFGYALFRQRYSNELEVPPEQLDDEVERAFYRLLFGEAGPEGKNTEAPEKSESNAATVE